MPTLSEPRSATRSGSRDTVDERRARGRAAARALPLPALADLDLPADRDPLQLLEEQARRRLPELRPIRYGRMLASPFGFLRGAARVMAMDLAGTARTGLTAQLCGDAHLANFGLFGSPERRMLFDANDFDETLPGPFEVDVRRLTASLEVAAREQGIGRKQRRRLVLFAGRRYREAMTAFAEERDLDVWYSRLDVKALQRELAPQLDPKRRQRLADAVAKARTRDSVQAFHRLTEVVDGRPRIRAEAPLLIPIRHLMEDLDERELTAWIDGLLADYRTTLQADRRALLERYEFVDLARKVVGVGSVGTRCWVVLLRGRDADDPLLLQVKEAEPSVLADVLGPSRFENQGERVVTGQRLMQQASDVFLGWLRTRGVDGVERDFMVRQLRDWKGALDLAHVQPDGLRLYGGYCAWCLARAHARSGDAVAIAGYLGDTEAFEEALADFAAAYADRTEADHALLARAVVEGRIDARTDL
ncbi:DUF2252 domain-containing protein [Amnibacterium sp.]|uniref:DUF2252 domain-containing protein n=1 Tax=Amnibacterium sp. TaxID=1872496 RepID=UPI003F7BD4E1